LHAGALTDVEKPVPVPEFVIKAARFEFTRWENSRNRRERKSKHHCRARVRSTFPIINRHHT
jgi:hypothetical protein